MNALPWQIEQQQARFCARALRARIDLGRPAQGLHELQLGGRGLAEVNLLGLRWPEAAGLETAILAEAHSRGNGLWGVYRATLPIQVDAQWRLGGPGQLPDLLAFADLILSVRTELLQSRPELVVQSGLPCQEILRLVSAAEGRFVVWDRSGASSRSFKAEEGPGCLVMRLPASELSYVEMVHPADFGQGTLEWLGPRVQTQHRLFAQPLEKGVVLRARIRGGLVPRAQDLRLATQAFAALAAEEPPLGA